MTMTSVAVAQGSLGAPSVMLSPNMYHSQQGLGSTSASPAAGKSHDTLDKGGKKSWSVKLGLSRQHTDGNGKNWGSMSNGSVLSRQMVYGDPWLYGTVRLNRPAGEYRAFASTPTGQQSVPSSAILPGSPVLVLCSCPEFLNGTTRKVGNCRRCGGHRWVGMPLGGTCRLPSSSSRCRPSLAGILRVSMDDPYDRMRRNRLLESRSRARSISPHRLSTRRDMWKENISRSIDKRGDQETFVDGLSSNLDWYPKSETSGIATAVTVHTTTGVTLPTLIATTPCTSIMASVNTPIVTSTCAITTAITPGIEQANEILVPSDYWLQSKNASSNTYSQCLNAHKHERSANVSTHDKKKEDVKVNKSGDTRKSILECDVNPYLLLRKRTKDEDDLSDELSDNALEREESLSSFNLFDSSKVRSIEKIQTRNTVAAISGQRVRVFNDPRKDISDDEELIPITKVPIPKISPKRPPRRLKVTAKKNLKSILKGGVNEKLREKELRREKSVLFNVGNVIFAPEKPTDTTWLSWNTISCGTTTYEKRKKQQLFTCNQNVLDYGIGEREKVQKTGKNELASKNIKHKFITVPNIHNTRTNKDTTKVRRVFEPKSSLEGIISDKPVFSGTNKFRAGATNVRQAYTFDKCTHVTNRVDLGLQTQKQSSNTESQNSMNSVKECKSKTPTDLKMTKEMNLGLTPTLSVDEKDLILKCEDRTRCSHLIRSRSDLSSYQRNIPSSGNIFFRDTMRISVSRRNKDTLSFRCLESSPLSFADTRQIVIESGNEIPKYLPNESSSAPSVAINSSDLFQKMRPTNWSPPPERQKQRHSSCNSMNDKIQFDSSMSASDSETSQVEKTVLISNISYARGTESPEVSTLYRNSVTKQRSLNAADNLSSDTNVCKITVSPQTSPLVHRLCIGSDSRSTKRTSITINGDPANNSDLISNNKVTISVGGEDSACNPTVISINNSSPPRSQNLTENRTLVILSNYRSNIIVKPRNENDSDDAKADSNNEQNNCDSSVQGETLKELGLQDTRNPSWNNELHGKHRSAIQHLQWQVYDTTTNENLTEKQNCAEHIDGNIATREQLDEHLLKEAVISKLLEDSLKKAKENGEILSEGNDEAIIKILKQSLLKGKERSKTSVVSSKDVESNHMVRDIPKPITTNLYLEENPYEVIKEPIYEEIRDEQPPPLPLNPPPRSDYFKDRMYFGEIDFYKLSSCSFSNINYDKPPFNDLMDSYHSKTSEDFLKKLSTLRNDESASTTFKLFNFLLNSKEESTILLAEDEDDEEDDDDADVDEDEDIEEEEEEDTERDLEALYEQKEASLGDLSSKSSQISNVSDSSEECNIILTSSSNVLKEKSADIERTDSGVGSESSQASSSRGVSRRWRTSHISSSASSSVGAIPQIISTDAKLCEDCEQRLEPLVTDSGVVYAPFICRKCSKKRAERKEIITEIVETEQKYGRDLKIILEEFHRPMLRAGLLTSDQLLAIFLNVEELLEHNLVLAEKLTDAVDSAQKSGDEDLITVDVGQIFLESERMLHAFESYCTRQGSASLLLQNLEKEKELLRIFLKVSQMENTVLRRMNLNSFLMVPVQRVTKYPLLLARLLKATPSLRADIQEAKKKLKQAQTNIELHLEHMNAEAKDITSTKLWRRISIIQNGRRAIGEQDMVNIKLRKMAVEVLEWPHEEARFVLEGRLLVAQPTDNNWRRGRTIKLVPVTAVLVTNGKPCAEYRQFPDDSLFSRHIGVKEATLLLVKEKLGRCTLLREPLYLDKCIVYCETNLEDYFEIQELSSKETFIFKAEDGSRTKKWCRTLQIHAQSLGAWRKRRGALPNIMICGVTRN